MGLAQGCAASATRAEGRGAADLLDIALLPCEVLVHGEGGRGRVDGGRELRDLAVAELPRVVGAARHDSARGDHKNMVGASDTAQGRVRPDDKGGRAQPVVVPIGTTGTDHTSHVSGCTAEGLRADQLACLREGGTAGATREEGGDCTQRASVGWQEVREQDRERVLRERRQGGSGCWTGLVQPSLFHPLLLMPPFLEVPVRTGRRIRPAVTAPSWRLVLCGGFWVSGNGAS